MKELATQLVDEFLATHPVDVDAVEFLGARYEAGLAWVSHPVLCGGRGWARSLQHVVDERFQAAGAPLGRQHANIIGMGMAAPTILVHGTEEQRRRYLRPIWTGEEFWCQLFSEPGAGSDLAGLATRATRQGTGWVVNGQKVWTTLGHLAEFALLVARTDPDVGKYSGMTYFVCDMSAPGVEVRPLRQITGEAEFNEVFLTDVVIPDNQRLGGVGDGWNVARTTLMNERVAIGGGPNARESGYIGVLSEAWRSHPSLRTPGMWDAILRVWVDAEVARLAAERLRQQLAAGQPGPEGSAVKIAFSRLNQEISGILVEFLDEEGLRYDDYSMRQPRLALGEEGRPAGYLYLRAKGNSIEGGTTEVLRNVIAERVLGLPPDIRADKGVAWKDIPR